MKPTPVANPSGISIQTSKTWVLPPRPKPGRKADTDNAPTKRKAQNREAQRAFRERRAARVGELEQQIRDIEAKHRLELEAIEVDNGRLKVENIKLRDAMDGLMRELNTIRSLTKLSQSPSHSMYTATLSQTQPHGTTTNLQMASPAPSADMDIVGTQGNSTPAFSPLRFDSIPETYLGQSVPLRRKSKRVSSETVPCSKRQKSVEAEGLQAEASDGVDYNFGAASFRPPSGESCGFCSDGTPCLCAEAAQQHAQDERRRRDMSSEEPEHHEICGSCFKATPCLCTKAADAVRSDDEEDGTDTKQTTSIRPLPTITEEDNGLCTGNPGSCKQCQLDPMSTLFCRTLASTSPPVEKIGKGLDRPRLTQQSSSFSTSSARDSTPPLPDAGQYVPCSAAYQTLSRHENFDGTDLTSIVRGLDVDRASGRGVAVGSVRDVLRILDRGLGRDI